MRRGWTNLFLKLNTFINFRRGAKLSILSFEVLNIFSSGNLEIKPLLILINTFLLIN